MNKVRFSFGAKIAGRILPCAVLVFIFLGLTADFRSVSAASLFSVMFGSAESAQVASEQNDELSTNDKARSLQPLKIERDLANFFPAFFSGANGGNQNSLFLLTDSGTSRAAVVRHGFSLNGRIEGSLQQLLGESTTFNSTGVLTGNLLVPGSPNLVRNGTSTFGGTILGSGSAQPSNYSITLNSGSQLGQLLTRTDAVSMPTVAAPPAPTGTRNVTINSSTQSIGDFSTLRNLTLNSNIGNKAIPPGAYGAFLANSGSGFILGTAGSTQAEVYNFSSLTLNSGSQVQVAGPVIITLGSGTTVGGTMGAAANSNWLELKIASGGLILNTGSAFYGTVIAPSTTGTITVNSRLEGNVTADRLTVNSGAVLKITEQNDTTPPTLTVQPPINGFNTNASQLTVSGTYADESPTTIKVNNITATITGNSFSANINLTEGGNPLNVIATDSSGNQTQVALNVTRDSISPVLTVEQPLDNSFYKTPTLTVSGTIADQTVTSVVINGVAAALSGNNFTANVSIIEGSNSITAIATDASGNSTQVVRQIVRDTIAPGLSIHEPLNETITANSTVPVTGTFSDANLVEIRINGVTAILSGDTFSATAPVIEGPGLVIVTAVDAAGNETSKERKITSATSLTMELQEPAEQFVTNSKSVRVAGSVSGIGVQVTVNGASFETVGGYMFGGDLELNEGSNIVRVKATDITGRTQEITRTVIVDTTAPVFSEISPAEGTLIDAATTTLSGKVTDLTTVTLEINDSPVTVDANGNFTIPDFSVAEGTNSVQIISRDQVGNSEKTDLSFQGKDRTAPSAAAIFPFSQETVMSFITLEGRAEPGTVLTINGGTEPATAEAAYGSGLFFANVKLANGVNTLSIIARDRAGNDSPVTTFNITSDPAKVIPPQQPVKINIATNDVQKGLTGQLLPRPLIARVTDKAGAPVALVPVTFSVVYGDGQLVGGTTRITVATDAEGQANASFLAGTKTGIQLI
ncbi:MAG TPA: hypothetical protein VGC97_10775, partial [Pyrinomonadaceae bacterium]